MRTARTFNAGHRHKQKPRLGKPLGREIYVASEASATALQNYAPQSRIVIGIAGSRPWTPPTQMLSTHASFSCHIFAGGTASNPGAERSQAHHLTRIFIMANVDHTRMANAIRGLAMDAVEKAKSGHPGLPMGAADVATVLFTQFLKFDAADPKWPDRDRFILSAGHGSMLLYALLYLTGNVDMTLDQLKHFRQLGSLTPGHPENFHTKGIETTTGPLGQGIATSVGFAVAEKMLAAEFGKKIVGHHTYVLASDGDLMEGVSQEAIALAGVWKLNKLIVLYDDNGISIDGPTSLADSVDQVKRFKSAGWAAELIDGQDQAAIAAAITRAQKSNKPSMIACKTTIGYGAPTKAGTAKAHGEALGADELKGAKEKLGISLEPFSVPDDVLKAWREAGSRGAVARKEWEARFAELGNRKRAEFQRRLRHERPASLAKAFKAHKKSLIETPQNIATRKSSESVIEAIAAAMPMEFLAGSADLTGSNNNKAKSAVAFSAKVPKGRFIHYGIREHGMCAAMNGIFLHGGFAPNGATFLVFTDYARPAMRLAALMGTGVVYVMTHDSIGLGEDGPTHQPVEHLSALRAIPNMRVFRPCDAMEVSECWELALNRIDGPTVLALTRQNLPQLRTTTRNDNPCSQGAYELVAASGEAKVSLFASGSEVEIAVAAQKQLAEKGIAARVVSVPSLELLLAQDEAKQRAIIGNAPVKIAIEAAVRWGWDAVIGHDGTFIGMHGFGASAPAKDLYKHFGITAEAVVKAAGDRVGNG
jgi:transketolase